MRRAAQPLPWLAQCRVRAAAARSIDANAPGAAAAPGRLQGIAFGAGTVEAEAHVVGVATHVTAIPQETGSSAEAQRWRVCAIHPEGSTLAVRAVGAHRTAYELDAPRTPGDRHVIGVKATRGMSRSR
ncbi:MAG: hypothetical protein IPM29_27680 [Planctomycetes bacterium]|nr:hypothetical protein [Planctomycetota bacterium]